MIKKRLKDAMVPGMYLIVIALFIVCLFMINDVVKGFILKDNSGGKIHRRFEKRIAQGFFRKG